MSAVNQASRELDDYVKFYEKLVETSKAKFSQIGASNISLTQIIDRNGNRRMIEVSDLTCIEVKDTKWKISIYHPGMMSLDELEKKRSSVVDTLEKIRALKKDSFELRDYLHEGAKTLEKQPELYGDDETTNQIRGFVVQIKESEKGVCHLISNLEKEILFFEQAIYKLAAGIPVDISKALERSGMLSINPYQETYNELKKTFDEDFPHFQHGFFWLMQAKKIIDPDLFQVYLKNLEKNVYKLEGILAEGREIWEEGPWDLCRDQQTKYDILNLSLLLADHWKKVDCLIWSIGQEIKEAPQ